MRKIKAIEAGTLLADCICAVVVMALFAGATCAICAFVALVNGL